MSEVRAARWRIATAHARQAPRGLRLLRPTTERDACPPSCGSATSSTGGRSPRSWRGRLPHRAPRRLDRAVLLPPLKAALARGRDEIRRRFEAGGAGDAGGRASRCFLIDQLIRVLFDFADRDASIRSPTRPPASSWRSSRSAAMAAASWRRYSDIDLLFLLPYKQTPHTEQVVEFLLYLLWDLGLKVGQATRSVDECLRYAKARSDDPHRAAGGALLWGEQALFDELKQALRQRRSLRGSAAATSSRPSSPSATQRHISASATSATRSSPTSRRARAACATCTRCSGSPNTSTASTTSAKLVDHGRADRPRSRARFERAAALPVDRALPPPLSRRPRRGAADLRPAARDRRAAWATPTAPAARGVERFMKHYFLVAKDVGDLTRIFCAVLEAEPAAQAPRSLAALGQTCGRASSTAFVVDGERLTIAVRRFLQARTRSADPAAVPCRAGARSRHPPARLARRHAIAAPDRREAARRPRGQPPVPRDPDLAEGPGDRAAADERGRRVRPLRARFRPRRRADAVRHVPRLHGRRAHALRDRHPAPDRDRRS